MAQSITTIYALSDPRQPFDLRYVGQTVQPLKNRLARHYSAAKRRPVTHKDQWLRLLFSSGLKPLVFILDEVSLDKSNKAEIHWIAAARRAGHRLTNLTDGGEGLFQHTEAAKQRISQHNPRLRSPQERTAYRLKLSGQHKDNGYPRTAKYRAKVKLLAIKSAQYRPSNWGRRSAGLTRGLEIIHVFRLTDEEKRQRNARRLWERRHAR